MLFTVICLTAVCLMQYYDAMKMAKEEQNCNIEQPESEKILMFDKHVKSQNPKALHLVQRDDGSHTKCRGTCLSS